jgi:hypothetical protein
VLQYLVLLNGFDFRGVVGYCSTVQSPVLAFEKHFSPELNDIVCDDICISVPLVSLYLVVEHTFYFITRHILYTDNFETSSICSRMAPWDVNDVQHDLKS